MRDNRLDVIRGLAVILITISHTNPGPVLNAQFGHYYISYFFFNFADVFVAFSGLVCGIVYRKAAEREGAPAVIRKGFIRAAQLFLYNALAFAGVLLIVALFNSIGVHTKHHDLGGAPWAQAFMGTVFLYAPIEFFNILNFYILLLGILPFFILAQLRFRWTILISGALYLGYEAFRFLTRTQGDAGTFFASPVAWQFLFFGAVCIGMYYTRVRDALPPLNRTIGPILLYFLVTHFMRDQSWIVHNFSDKYDLGFLRIVDLVLVCYLIDRLVPPDVKITAPVVQSMAAVGANSLFCFSVSLMLCYLASNVLTLVDGHRAVYLVVLLCEIFAFLALGNLLRRNEGFRRLTQIRWVEKLFPAGRSSVPGKTFPSASVRSQSR
ncbi:hypothetical protein D2T29_13600 [Sinirhodobacter populi]|uniref:OpgC domain-containing protein n=1 Tax=Paenirhodobacter populi TaxID=2306993 RepID=A0A443KAI5_9RHOB|nr:OpgC domain-containing protein [Sinirhodobacter populi]RWR29817.1 hypothetical protein D2T29_13600 [Sinirhodobacter populi]